MLDVGKLPALKEKFGHTLSPLPGRFVLVRDTARGKNVGILENSFTVDTAPFSDGRRYIWPLVACAVTLVSTVVAALLCLRFSSLLGPAEGDPGAPIAPADGATSQSSDKGGNEQEVLEPEELPSANLLPADEALKPGEEGREDRYFCQDRPRGSGSKCIQVILLIALWWGAAVYVTLMFKVATVPPFMLTFLVNTCTGLVSWVLSQCIPCPAPTLPAATGVEIAKIALLGVVQGCEIGTLNKSLQYLSISERTMLQNTNIMFMMIAAQLCQLERLTPKRIVAGALLSCGGLCQGLASSGIDEDGGAAEALSPRHVRGIAFILISMMLTATKWSLIQFITQHNATDSFLGKISKLQLSARVQPITGLVCLCLAAFLELHTAFRPDLWQWDEAWRVPAIALGITAIMGSELKLVQMTSAVATGVLMNLHHIPMALVGIFFFHDTVGRLAVFGAALCVSGGIFYAAARNEDPGTERIPVE